MKKLLSVLLLLATLLSLAACGGTPPEIEEIPEGMQIAERGDGYTLYAPEDWVIDRSTGITTAYVSAVDPSNITLVRVETDKTPAAYFDESRARLATLFEELAYHDDASSDNTTFGGRAAIVRVYSGKLLGTSYTVKQYLCKTDGTLYLFTYTAKNEIPSGEKTYFERYEETVDAAAAAFAFTGSATPPEETEDKPPVTNADGLVLLSDPAVSRYSLWGPATWAPDLRNGTTSATREGAVLTLSYELPKEASIGEYWEAKSADYAKLYENYDLLEEECSPPAEKLEDVTVWLDGRQAVRYVFTFTRAGVTYKTQKLMTVDGIYVYTLTYTAVYTDGVTDPYTAYLSDLEAVRAAFTFD